MVYTSDGYKFPEQSETMQKILNDLNMKEEKENLNQMESINLRQKIDDKLSIFILEQLINAGKIKILEPELVEKLLNESDNPWLKQNLCNHLLKVIGDYKKDISIDTEAIFSSVIEIEENIVETKEASLFFKARQLQLWDQRPRKDDFDFGKGFSLNLIDGERRR